MGRYVEYLLSNIKECANRILFMVNGEIDEKGKQSVLKYTSEIYVRKNTGFDVGAYKIALLDCLYQDLSNYDEVIFCNNTFYGPFKRLKDIFFEMKRRQACDFWGMSYIQNNFANHVQSYLMVFGRKIIERGLLQQYFSKYVDENLLDIKFLYFTFEAGFFRFLTYENGMRFGCYSDIENRNIYSDASACLRICHLPILKRKSAARESYDKNSLINALKFIKEETDYDVSIILDDLKANYDIEIEKKDFDGEYRMEAKKGKVFVSCCTPEKIRNFIESDTFYIMGAGGIATTIYWLYAKDSPNFLGFVVSDQHKIGNKCYLEKAIYKLSEIEAGHRIIVAMNPVHSEEVRFSLHEYETLYII